MKWKPLRFVDLISYEHSTVHPLEVFMYKCTTSILRILESGSGMITANMREVPAAAMMEAGIQVETFAPHCLTRTRDMEIVTKMAQST
ncbi:MAG: DUF128 domain-containing protein [Thaumarchaeota archaeon]|nr:DUF128 domain-containing protein [Nitrososphaerota archaeon]